MTMLFKRITLLVIILSLLLVLCICVGKENTAAETVPTEPVAAGEASPIPTAETESGPIYVSTVDELLAAIAPNAEILLEDGVYTLSDATGYGRENGRYYEWQECYDGYELVINNVSGLSISGPGADRVTISALPRYANVLSFYSCGDLRLSGFTAGHKELPGECMGGVLNFSCCHDVGIDGCSLFGCGILGVQAMNCRALHTVNTEIYDCSYGGVYVNGCRDVLFDGCRIHDCTGWSGLIDVFSSSEVAVTNSEICNNSTPIFLTSFYSDGVYIGGDEVKYNGFTEGMFALSGYPATVDGCSFAYNNTGGVWYLPYDRWNGGTEVVYTTDAEGRELYGGDLEAMQLRENVRWEAKKSSGLPVLAEAIPKVSEDGAVHVSTVDEFLAAIAPDTKIYLEDGVYDLSTATGYGSYSNSDYYRWDECFDGPALAIHDVQNLTIMAGGADKVTITAEPRYADVLFFKGCAGITLSGFTAGHTEEPGTCTGGVLYFCRCDATHVENCSLYGCGILGITAELCEGLEVVATEIHDCSCGAVSLNQCFDVHFEKCSFHDNNGPDFMAYNCMEAYADGQEILSIRQ